MTKLTAVTDETISAAKQRIAPLALALSFLSHAAFAQVAGGGAGGTWLQGALQTFLTYVAPGLGVAAIAVVGILAMGARLGMLVVCGIVVGIYIVSHADQIYGLIAL